MIRLMKLVAASSALLFALLPTFAHAQVTSPARNAETIRNVLLAAERAFTSDPRAAQRLLAEAETLYDALLAQPFADAAPAAHVRAEAGFRAAHIALDAGSAAAWSSARTEIAAALNDGVVLLSAPSAENTVQVGSSGQFGTETLWLSAWGAVGAVCALGALWVRRGGAVGAASA